MKTTKPSTSPLQEATPAPARDGMKKFKSTLYRFVDESAKFFTGAMPPAVELRLAELHEVKRNTAADTNSNQESEKVKETDYVANAPVKNPPPPPPSSSSPLSFRSPRLLTEDRVSKKTSSEVWQFAWNFATQLLNFHMFWSYLVLAMLLLQPVTTLLALFFLTVTVTSLCALYDLAWSYLQGHDIKKFMQRYIDYGMEKWRAFLSGKQRRAILIVFGIAMNPPPSVRRSKWLRTKRQTSEKRM